MGVLLYNPQSVIHELSSYYLFPIPLATTASVLFWNIEMPFEPTLHHPLRLNGFSLVCGTPKLFRSPAMEKQQAKNL